MAEVAHTILGVHTRLHPHWPIAISDEDALSIGMCGCIQNTGETIDMICNRHMAKVVRSNIASVSVNNAEFSALMKHVSTRGIDASSLNALPWFSDKRDRIYSALSCTLAERDAFAKWSRASVQLSCVLCMHCRENPIEKLDSILGAVVRSDVRRVDDLHFECVDETPDPFALSVVLRLLSRAIL